MAKKKPKFFCDFCGNEVSQKDIFCKNCGKFFAAVRCPECGTTGTSEKFANGCPKCGYAFNNSQKGNSGQVTNSVIFHKHKRNTSGDSLPLWVYILTVSALVLIVLLFIMRYV